MSAATSNQARTLHGDALVIDLHNDMFILRVCNKDSLDVGTRNERYQADLPRMVEGGCDAAFVMCGDTKLTSSLRILGEIWASADRHSDRMTVALCAEDVLAAKREGKVALIPQLESLTLISRDFTMLRAFYQLGVRAALLTHGEGGFAQWGETPHGACTPAEREAARHWPGLTSFGRECVRVCEQMGILVDCAHTYDSAFYELLEVSTKPVTNVHANCNALKPNWLNLTDDQMRALAQNGGVMGITMYWPAVHDERPTVSLLVDHLAYALDVAGEDHVCLGTDYDGMGDRPPVTPDPPDVSGLPRVTEEMLRRGFGEVVVRKVLGLNLLRVIRATIG